MARRRQQKLHLEASECSMIKGLINHTDLNDQMIVAMFSHLSRTINHREIGYFRDSANIKYREVVAASPGEVYNFMARYQRFEQLAKLHGMVPQELYFQLVQKACEAMKTSVAIFNNPHLIWKSEIFVVNAIIAWTYLMHAHYSTQGIDYRYKKDGQLILTDEGRPKHWELSKCLNVAECPLPNPVKANVRYLIAIRNEIEHRMSDNIDSYLASKLQACALNFNHWLCEWFGRQCSIAEDLSFAIQFKEISLKSHPDNVGAKKLPGVIETVNALIEGDMLDEDYNDPRYSYRVYVVPKTVNNKNKADQAVVFADIGTDLEVAIREVERPKFKPSQIVEMMRAEGFGDFSLYGKGGFVEFRKSIDAKHSTK